MLSTCRGCFSQIRLLLLGFIVFGTLLSSFHYHNDGHVDDECKVCLIQHNFDLANHVDSFKLGDIDTKINSLDTFTFIFHNDSFKSNFFSRAPPPFS